MQRKTHIIPHAPIEKMISYAGAKRVGNDAVEELCDFLTRKGIEIAKKASELSSHSGRKTVMADDIRLADEL